VTFVMIAPRQGAGDEHEGSEEEAGAHAP
jgi:hypothetical protein